jgi:hypothetical protein
MDFGAGSQWQSEKEQAQHIVAELFELPSQDIARSLRISDIRTFDFQSSAGSRSWFDVPELDERLRKIDPHIFLKDALEDVVICWRLADFCNERGLPILCAYRGQSDAEPIPVLVKPAEADKLTRFGRIDLKAALVEVSGIHLTASMNLRGFPPMDAVGFFRKGLAESIAVRLMAASTTGKSTGYDFELSTKTSGLSSFWTLAAALIKGKYFGHPTSPVVGKLGAGRFCFGVGATGGTANYDMTTYFDIPAQSKGYVDL